MYKLATTLTLSISAMLLVAGAVPQTASAAQTTWQKFVKRECKNETSADRIARCQSALEQDLKQKCGEANQNNRYIECWRGFINSYPPPLATANSSPFEEEERTQGPTECPDIETNIIPCDDNGGNPVISLLLQVINFLAVGVGIAVVGGIIWGGFIYASSNGDANKVQQAKVIIVNAVIGLLLFFFMFTLINYLVPGGLFT